MRDSFMTSGLHRVGRARSVKGTPITRHQAVTHPSASRHASPTEGTGGSTELNLGVLARGEARLKVQFVRNPDLVPEL